MARIVCQVLQRSDQLTFVWSQDEASFEPYHLDASETAQFCEAARQAREHLAKLLAGGDSKQALVKSGHDLYQLIFRSPTAQKVEQWLKGLGDSVILDLISDAPGRVPWNAVYAESPSNSPNLQGFWGVRYALTCGKRVNPLRLDPFIAAPNVLQVVDAALPSHQRDAWQAGGTRSVSTLAELKSALLARCPDLLCWVGGFSGRQLTLGGQTVSLRELRTWIEEAEEGSTEPLFLLNAVGGAGGWHEFLTLAAAQFPGLITWEGPAPPEAALGCGVRDKLAGGSGAVGRLLRDLRRQQGWLALGLTAFCPSEVYLGEMSPDAEVKSRVLARLPNEPFYSLKSLDAAERPLLAGRDRDIYRCAAVLDEPAASLLVLHGSASAGKTSFLRAGLVPYLENDTCAFLALRDRTELQGDRPNERSGPAVTVRAGRDVIGQLAAALCFFCDRPYVVSSPAGEEISIPLPKLLWQALQDTVPSTAVQEGAPKSGPSSQEAIKAGPMELAGATATQSTGEGDDDVVVPPDLWEALDKDPELLGRVLDSLSRSLPHDLLILIEQGEEIFTQSRVDEDKERRARALKMLLLAAARAPRCKIVLSMRSDFLGQLHSELAANLDLPAQAAQVREFLLPDMNRSQLLQALLLPTATEPILYASEVPFNKYKFAFNEKFTEELVDEVCAQAEKARQSPIALLQVVCQRMYEQRIKMRGLKTLDKIDLKSTGGLEDAVGKDVDARVRKLPIPRFLGNVLRALMQSLTTSHADGTVTRDIFNIGEVEQTFQSKLPGERLKELLTIAGGAVVFLVGVVMAVSGLDYRFGRLRISFLVMAVGAAIVGGLAALRFFRAPPSPRPATEEAGQPEPVHVRDAKLAVSAAEKAGLLEVQPLLIDGQEEMYASLPRDSIARVAQDWNEMAKTRKYAWTKIVDQWFIALPLLLLAVMLTWKYTEYRLHPRFEQLQKDRDSLEDQLIGLQVPKYVGDLARADEAWQAGSINLMRQALLTQQGPRRIPVDLRGFEWYYLWHLANSEKQAFKGHQATVRALAVSPDGKVCATSAPAAANDGRALRLFLWDLATGKKRATLHSSIDLDAVAFSSDGKFLVTAGEGNTLNLWDAQAGKDGYVVVDKPLRSLKDKALTGNILALASPRVELPQDVKKASPDLKKETPDPKKDAPKKEGSDAKKDNKEPAAKDDKKEAPASPSYLLSAGVDRTIILWDLSKEDKGAVVKVLSKHASPVQTLALAGAGKLASGDTAGNVILWNLSDADPVKNAQSFDLSSGAIRSLVFSADGKKLFVGGVDPSEELGPGEPLGFIRMLDLDSKSAANPADKGKAGEQAKEKDKDKDAKTPDKKEPAPRVKRPKFTGVSARHGTEVFALALSPDGRLLASGGTDNMVRLWDAATLAEIGPIKGHMGWVRSLAFTPNQDDYRIVSGSFDGTGKMWRPVPSQTSEMLVSGAGPMTTLDISNDGKLLAAGGKQGKVYLWNVVSGKLDHVFDLKRPVAAVAFNHTDEEPRAHHGEGPKPMRLAIAINQADGKDENEIQVWEFGPTKEKLTDKDKEKAKGKDKARASEPEELVRTLVYSAKVPAGNGLTLASVAISPDGDIVIYNSDINVGRLDVGKKAIGTPYKGHDQRVLRVAFSPDGKSLAAGALDGKIRVWNTFGGEIANSPLKAHAGPVLALSFPEPEIICSTGTDRTAKLWILQEGTYRERVFQRSATASSVAVDLRHSEILEGCWDGSIRIIRARVSKFFAQAQVDMYSLRGHTGPIRAIALTPFWSSNQLLASTGDDGTVRLWRAPPVPRE